MQQHVQHEDEVHENDATVHGDALQQQRQDDDDAHGKKSKRVEEVKL